MKQNDEWSGSVEFVDENHHDEHVDSYGLKELGWDRVPHNIADKTFSELMNLDGKRIIVTGAGGPGLGFQISSRLAQLGAEVVLTDINEAVNDKAKEVAEKWNAKTHAITADLMDYNEVANMFKKANDLMGGIDILINNANFTRGSPFEKFDEKAIRESIDGPYTSVVFCCRHVCDYMISQGSGRIINISSESSVRSDNVDISIYASSKAAVNGFTKSLAGELAKYNIIVNCVAPGVMLHSQLKGMFENPVPETLGVRKSMVISTEDCLLKRVSIPAEVANTVAFLCSDAATFIDGQVIMNGGGMTV